MAFSFQPKVVSDGLVLYVDAGNTKSYPGSGTVWTDLSSTQITGSLTNGPTFNSASGGSIRFDGTNDYVDLGTNSTLNFTGPFSVSVWTNVNLSGQSQYFVNRWTFGTGNFRQWSIDNIKGGIYPAPVQSLFHFRISSNGTDAGSVFISSSVSASYSNNWVNVCAIWDASFIYLYINGLSANTRVSAPTMVSTSGQKTFIGGSDTGTALPPSGSIAITSIYNRALSAAEVLQNYNALKGRFNLT
jgi:hypothetical protein